MKEEIKKAFKEEREYLSAKIFQPAIFCAVAFFTVAAFYYVASTQDIAAAREIFDRIGKVSEEKGFFAQMSNFELFGMIFSNNAAAGGFVLFSGIVPFIFLPFWAVASNAALVGVVVAVAQDSGSNPGAIILSLLPHGIVELPALFITAGMGLRVGFVATKKIIGRGKDLSFKKEMLGAWRSYALVALPMFLLAAFVEAFVTVLLVK